MIHCSFFTYQYMQIHFNTNKYVLIQIFGWKTCLIRSWLYWLYYMYCFFKYKPNTCQYRQIPAQYKYNTFMTKSKPVVVEGRVLACICMFFACFLYVFACICLYWKPSTTTGSLQCCIACIACIDMYWYVFAMYWYVFRFYIQAVYKRIRTYKPIQTKNKPRIYDSIVYVECMYFYVFVCIDYEHEDYFLELIIPKDM